MNSGSGAGRNPGEVWSSIPNYRKTVMVVMMAAVLFSSYFFLKWMFREEMAPLFTNIQPDDAGTVVTTLKEMDVSYELTDQGGTILVPESKVYELRLSLAGQGVFAGSDSGFELFDETQLGTTDFERHLNYQRALQEELRRTIVQLDSVSQARVHLVLPQQSVFIENSSSSKASVAVDLVPGKRMLAENVLGIVELVSKSVEGLTAENVSVIDTQGNILSRNILLEEDSFTAQQAEQNRMKADFEGTLEQRLNGMLEQVYGIGKVVTMISANLDFSQKEVNSIVWGDGVIRSEQVLESTEGDGPSAYAADTEMTLETYPDLQSADQSSAFSRESIRNYEINKTEEKVIQAPGKVNNISVSVAVDKIFAEDEVGNIEKMVAAAIGLNPERGDQVVVSSMSFDRTFQEETASAMADASVDAEKQAAINRYLMLGLRFLAVVAVFIVLRQMVKAVTRSLPQSLPASRRVVTQPQVEEEVDLRIPVSVEQKKQAAAKNLVMENPESAVQIIRTWLNE